MPSNLCGPDDNYDAESSHVLAALIRKFHDAKVRGEDEVVVWGTGTPRREFLHVDDLADALVLLMQTWSEEQPINVGTGKDVTILELAQTIAGVLGYKGQFVFDNTKPDAAPRTLLEISQLAALGWRPGIDLETGIRQTYKWYRKQSAGFFQNLSSGGAR